ncbi:MULTISPECIES: hypothetical protein [Staphylococcus]|jgi:hypothetical protein|uniref:Uncharacterized protein n=2 Tax=Staphylococcus shinii TaxID=2912228 RepID=A0A418IJC3_9STAP|nr:hypothetical protein [Staphylococcus shinii]MBO3065622.1 hypothetical protein [Staphylococcus shinii]MDW8565675.1 hypothetical protein [Staphylococcus shinii]MDW8566179.1 hypothetical protein [Staphylococcus shinii]MDW8569100.1 hypothetical protein [Staphylococcus shinii]MDW8572315.1 hypothetical protein [Staphylococcus shinii]
MYHLELHNLKQRITKLLNLIELYKYGIMTDHRDKLKFQQDLHTYIEHDYNDFIQNNLHHNSLFHYNYFNFLSNQIEDPMDEFTIGNTLKHIETVQERLLKILKLLSAVL